MTGIAHLSTGLLLKARFPRAPLLWLLLAAEASDLVWVALNLLRTNGHPPFEMTRVEQPFDGIGSLKLLEQPFSHSLIGNLLLASFLGGLAYLAWFKRSASVYEVALPVALAVLGHFLLDFLVHDADLALFPWSSDTRLGPALGADSTMPTLGLSATKPLLSWGLQSLVVVVSGAFFLLAYPSNARRRWIFGVLLIALCFTPAPMFVGDLAPRLFPSTNATVLATLMEAVGLTAVLYLLVTRITHPALRPRYGPYSEPLSDLLRGYSLASSALAGLLAATYLLEAGLAGQRLPAVAFCSVLMGIVYIGVCASLANGRLSAWWLALFAALLMGPGFRLATGSGPLGFLVGGLEALLALGALISVLRLRSYKLTL